MRRTHVAVTALALLASCSSSNNDASQASSPAPGDIVADLRADSNRDGRIRFDDDSDAQKTSWDAKAGAIFLANIDDDLERCPKLGDDATLPNCNDAENEVVDGPDDLLDLARLETRPWPAAPDDATATVTITQGKPGRVRLFVRTGYAAPAQPNDFTVLGADGAIGVDALRAGAELAIEAKDIVRDPAVWDGFVVVTLTVASGGKTATDAVKMRVAPVLTFHHLLPTDAVYVTNTGDRANQTLRDGLTAACSAASAPTPTEFSLADQWTQDLFETGYMSLPGDGGAQHVIRVAYRSANVDTPGDALNPLRDAGKVVFENLRGKDFAGVQQFDPNHDPAMDSLNSCGNFETIPPFGEFPFGRVLRGKTATFFPDPTFVKMVEAQGQQPPVYIDTSWLFVGHVDETISFVKAKTPRGWALLVNDPTLAKKMLDDQVTSGNGTTPMFVGLSWYDDSGKASAADTTVSGVLANTDVMQTSAKAAASIDAQLTKIKAETGITDAEIIRIPYLHMSVQGQAIAYQPGTVNGVYVSDTHFVAPDPHGPVIGGADIFKTQMTTALAPLGVTVHFVDDWDDYHSADGEVHCGTNTTRKIPDAKWWESAR
jgi:protein-arginine deiminase